MWVIDLFNINFICHRSPHKVTKTQINSWTFDEECTVGRPRAHSGEESADAGDARDTGSMPGLRRSLGGGKGKPLQYSCLGSPMGRGACQATVHGATKSWTGLSTHTRFGETR